MSELNVNIEDMTPEEKVKWALVASETYLLTTQLKRRTYRMYEELRDLENSIKELESKFVFLSSMNLNEIKSLFPYEEKTDE